MKTGIFFIYFFFAFKMSYSQIQITGKPFLDAMLLDKLIEAKSNKVYDVLNFYNKKVNNRESATEIFTTQTNPFLNNVINCLPKKLSDKKLLEEETESFKFGKEVNLSHPFQFGEGNLPSTAAIDAIGTFVASRFKEELNLAYLDKLKEKLKSDPYLQMIFPNTFKIIQSNDAFNYNVFIQSLKESFEKDLQSIPDHLSPLIIKLDQNKKIHFSASNDNAVYLTSIFLDIFDDLYKGRSVISIINNLDVNPYLLNRYNSTQLTNSNIIAGLRLTSLLSRSLSDNDGNGWVSQEELKVLLKTEYSCDSRVFNLFIGLLLEKESYALSKIFIESNVTLKDQLINKYGNLDEFAKYIIQLFGNFETLETVFKEIKDKELKSEDYYKLGQSLLNSLNTGLNIYSLSNGQQIDSLFQSKYIPLAESVLDIYQAVLEKKYGLVITKTVSIIAILTDNIQPDIAKYGTFMVNVINAKTSDEMEVALETAAMPVQSYMVKRNHPFNISINAYGGVFGGIESLQTDTITIAKKSSGVFGFTAPVGIAMSIGKRKGTELDGKSLTLFLPLIDVGAVFSFRLQDGTSTLPNLSWANVIAPGAYLIYGFKNSPLSLGVGAQYGPQLRKVKLKDNSEINSQAWRVNATLTVDIPVFNLYTKNR